ncbi:MAG: transcription termination/antitermination protein NusA [Bacteroidetes bacterium HGW-Bacteroidetes-6]|jgi:N utilization substance protein A|nr:MAG: transcription termination/antitermination protein NusA [Bacteroidetes bacterium HGW-Bacteroidetes-6]
METMNLVESFSEFKDSKAIDRPTLMKILVDIFKHILAKKFEVADNFDVIVNTSTGDLEIWHSRTIVADVDVVNPTAEIAYSEAIKIEPDFEVGEQVVAGFDITNFDRRDIQSIHQMLKAKVMEFEKENIYQKYKERIGEIVSGEVSQVWKKELLILDDEDYELVLPRTEMIQADFYKKGDTIRAVVDRVEFKNSTPFVILSRTSPVLLERLFEQEVPEIFDGLITIRKIVRQPGDRAKVAVESYDDRIDPVGACVGMKGSRIHGIVRELRNENIDVINYSANLSVFVSRALSPAKISSINIKEENKTIEVYLKPDQISLAIGKGGQNIKLASKLVDYEIEVFREIDTEFEDDVDLMEFSDEIDEWIIETFKKIGCDTAKSVLEIPRDELVVRADLEEETVDEVLRILRSEFE